MSRAKPNPFAIILGAVAAVVAGGLGYLVYSAYANFTAVGSEYDAQVGRLHSLQNRSPFPSEENLQRVQALNAEYRQEFENFVAEVAKMNHPIDDLTPQAFQDRLREVVSAVQAAAEENGVALPDDFYMGFRDYRGSLPADRAAAPLGRQLAAIQAVVQKIIDLRATSIESLSRASLPEERGPAAKDEAVPVLQAFPFSVSFVAEQGAVRQILNSIAGAEQFFVIRSLTVTNSAPDGPPRAGSPAADQQAAPGPATDPLALLTQQLEGTAAGETAKEALNVLVGREMLRVDADIEIIAINPPAPNEG